MDGWIDRINDLGEYCTVSEAEGNQCYVLKGESWCEVELMRSERQKGR